MDWWTTLWLVALTCLAWLHGHSTGTMTWRAKYNELKAASTALVVALEKYKEEKK